MQYPSNTQNFFWPLPIQGRYPPTPSSFLHGQFPLLVTLPPPGFSTMSQAPSSKNYSYSAAQPEDQSSGDVKIGATSEGQLLEGMTPTYAMPIFDGQGIKRSLFAIADDFAA
jgi:hypothetical protein